MSKIPFYFSLVMGLSLQNAILQAEESQKLGHLLGLSLDELLDIPVLGQGETRQVQDILAEEIRYSIPGSNPLKVLQRLPGVHFQSADPWGNYEWSTKLSIRGFKERQLGFTLDDIPLGDMVYGNNNGLHVGRGIILENIEKIRLAQGSSALETPSAINLGGAIQFVSNDPKNFESVMANQSWGSSNALRTYLRADTGKIGNTKAYISVARLETDKWKGEGLQAEQNQLNAKITHALNEHNISLFMNLSQRKEIDYADYSVESAQRLGWNWDNYYPDWERSVNAAKGITTGKVTSLDDAYYVGRGLRYDQLVGLSSLFKLNKDLDLKTTAYYHFDRGQGHWYTPYISSSPEVPLSLRVTSYKVNRYGIVSRLNWKRENHDISTGVWLEKNYHYLGRTNYKTTSGFDTDVFLADPDSVQFKQHFNSHTQQFHIQDTFTIDDLKVSMGGKSPHVRTVAHSEVGNRAEGTLTTSKTFLPQVGLNYTVDKQNELFVSYTQNVRAFSEGRLGPFDGLESVFSPTKERLKPELSTTIDVGWRLKQDKLQASLALYSVLFKDRLAWLSQCSSILGCPYTLANVGTVKTKGLEATVLWMPLDNVSWFSAFTYNDSKYQSDYLDGTTLIEAAGKTTVDTPKILFSSDVTYEKNGYFARLGGKYTGKRYLTYTNDLSVSGFSLWDLSVGYQYKKTTEFNNMRLQFNVDNLFDKKYFSSIGTNGFISHDPEGLSYTLQQGNNRQFFFSLSLAF